MLSLKLSVLVGLIFIGLLGLLIESKRDGNQKLKTCCARQKTADKACKRRFCDFHALSQDNVGYRV